MNNPADRIRDQLRALVAQRIDVAPDAMILETTLIRDGMYCGRRFVLEGFQVILFAEEEQIKVFSPDGSLERTSRLSEFVPSTSSDSRRAA